MSKKTIRVFGTYYSETDRGRGYVEEFDFTTEIETDLTGGQLLSFVQKKFIETFLRAKYGRDKFKGWQTCQVQELETPVAPAGKSKKDKSEKDNLGII